MKDRIKWLGRYIGCEMVWIRLNKITRYEITPLNIHTVGNYKEGEVKIVLKELKDITEDDLKHINALEEEYIIKLEDNNLFIIDLCYINLCEINRTSLIIDELRELGYAVGTPKEYYTTEDELKNETKDTW